MVYNVLVHSLQLHNKLILQAINLFTANPSSNKINPRCIQPSSLSSPPQCTSPSPLPSHTSSPATQLHNSSPLPRRVPAAQAHPSHPNAPLPPQPWGPSSPPSPPTPSTRPPNKPRSSPGCHTSRANSSTTRTTSQPRAGPAKARGP